MMMQVAAGILIAAGIIGTFALGAAVWTHDSRNRSPTVGGGVMLVAVGAALAVIYIAA
jgi:hypothetical protein